MALVPKILLVSDQQTTSPFWAFNTIQPHWDITLEHRPGHAVERWSELRPDLVLCDLESESLSIDIVAQLRGQAILPILLLTSNHSEKFILAAYAAGTDECILKPIHPSLLAAKIRAWLRHSATMPVDGLESLKVDDFQLIPADRTVVLDDRAPIHLTNLELRLLYYLMGRMGRTIATEELCQHIWGTSSEADTTTLKKLVYRLRHKIEEEPSRPRYVHTIVGVGYQFLPRVA